MSPWDQRVSEEKAYANVMSPFCSGIYMETDQAGRILGLRPANETALLCNVSLARRNPDQGRNKMAHVLQSFQMIFFLCEHYFTFIQHSQQCVPKGSN